MAVEGETVVEAPGASTAADGHFDGGKNGRPTPQPAQKSEVAARDAKAHEFTAGTEGTEKGADLNGSAHVKHAVQSNGLSAKSVEDEASNELTAEAEHANGQDHCVPSGMSAEATAHQQGEAEGDAVEETIGPTLPAVVHPERRSTRRGAAASVKLVEENAPEAAHRLERGGDVQAEEGKAERPHMVPAGVCVGGTEVEVKVEEEVEYPPQLKSEPSGAHCFKDEEGGEDESGVKEDQYTVNPDMALIASLVAAAATQEIQQKELVEPEPQQQVRAVLSFGMQRHGSIKI